MKIMIVEDEPLLRQGLISKIDWNGRGIRLVAEAGNGIEALEQLSRCEPDVVLTDVRMPGMDGLQLIDEARRAYPRLKFVILSGFNEFDYVREAMRHQVKDYLLKPVDARKLHELLAEIGNEVRMEQEEAIRRSELTAWAPLLDESDARATDHVLTHRILVPEGSWNRLPQHLLGRSRYAAATARIALPAGGGRFGERDLPLGRFAMQNVLQHALSPLPMDCLVFKHAYEPDEVVLFLGCDDADIVRDAVACLSDALAWTRERLGLNVVVGLGGVHGSISRLRDSYLQAKEAMNDRLLRGDGRVYVYEDDATATGESGLPPFGEDAERTLLMLLEENKREEFIARVHERFREIAERPDARYGRLAYAYAEIWHLVRRHAAKRGVVLPAPLSGDPASELASLSAWTELAGRFRDALRSWGPPREREDDCSGDRVVAAVKAYADSRFDEDLSLQWVADTYFIHPNYFAKRFKQLVGVSFGGYVTQRRIERSRELLLTTTLKIARVAQLVGYEDQNYFCNVFKKHSGVSPSAFRGES
ncbi:response regulator [Cohnella nanjingensis]|uniref:Response regulator n=1 Tax=Cohnella nanjingensis TaxID=1387779 RepID=A0A7X0RPP1_9BACL|nr:response regulator [Cohnella nanjingensis]MBB6671372.1 response regulator [Cohnella nanjingensis]